MAIAKGALPPNTAVFDRQDIWQRDDITCELIILIVTKGADKDALAGDMPKLYGCRVVRYRGEIFKPGFRSFVTDVFDTPEEAKTAAITVLHDVFYVQDVMF